jgi:hypothetical protein
MERTEHYALMAKELGKVKDDCLGRHPTLREDNILQFEAGL